jgi:hypothetical protein
MVHQNLSARNNDSAESDKKLPHPATRSVTSTTADVAPHRPVFFPEKPRPALKLDRLLTGLSGRDQAFIRTVAAELNADIAAIIASRLIARTRRIYMLESSLMASCHEEEITRTDWPSTDDLTGEGYDPALVVRLPRDHTCHDGRLCWHRDEVADLLAMVADRRAA